jgi:hypothetical protein
MNLSKNYKHRILTVTLSVWDFCRILILPKHHSVFAEFLSEMIEALESETRDIGFWGTLVHIAVRSSQICIYLFGYYRQILSGKT